MKIHKVLALPATLEDDSLYFVKNGANADLYITDNAGLAVYVGVTGAGTGDLLSTLNLSDLDNAATARTNLGLGTAAVAATGDFATSAQGATADAAEPSQTAVSQAEAEAGTVTSLRSWTPQRVAQAIAALATGTPEGTAIVSTGETVGKVLQADGDDTCSWVTLAGGGDALVANPLSQFAATSSAQLLGVISDETGSGALVFATSPALVTPDLGVPTAIDLTNATNTPDASTDVTLAGTGTYISIVGQVITVDPITESDISDLGAYLANLSEDTTPSLGGTLDGDGNDIIDTGVLTQREQAAAEADVAGAGQWWTQTATPNRPMFTDDTGQDFELLQSEIGWACSDEATALTTGQKIAVDFPYDFTITRVYASLVTAGTTSSITIDLEDEGVSLLNAVLTLTDGSTNAETSTFASAATSYALAKGDLFSIDLDSVDSGGTGAGLKVFLIGYRT